MQQLPADLWLVLTVFGAGFGACIGSFLNVCIYRIPLDQSIIKPRSHCMTCGKLIPWYHNLPVISYFLLRGKCANCKAPFSFRYAGIEMLTAFLFVVACCMFPPAGSTPPLGLNMLPEAAAVPILWLFMAGLIVATFVDLDHFIIPDSVSIGGMAAGLILSTLVPSIQGETWWLHGLATSAIGLAAGFVPLQIIRLSSTAYYRRRGRIEKDEYAMGFGDIKLVGAIGAFTGWQGAAFSIVSAAFFGTLVALPLLAAGRRKLLDRLPFGPYLALGSIIWIFWGEKLVGWYLAVLRPVA